MGLILCLSLSLYFSTLVSFSFISHSILCCVLLVCNLLSACCVAYVVLGFGWYIVLLCLVYVGGVYILFIFVSVYAPNSSTCVVPNLFCIGLLFVFFFSILWFGWLGIVPRYSEESYYFCSSVDGLSYCFLCVVLLLGFICVSMVMNFKDSFYR